MNHPPSHKKIPQKEEKQRLNLITVDRKYSLMNKVTKQQVESHLESELDYLLGRKELDLMRKRKAKEVEEAFERQRISRISKMDEKISRSDKNRAQTLRDKRSRSKRNLEFIDQKIKKKAEENQEQLQKMLEAQQQYIKRSTASRNSTKSFNRSSSNLNISRSFNHNLLKTQLQKSLDSIDSRIELIQSRIDQAKTNQQFYHRQKSERAKGFYKNVDQTLEKIHANQVKKETKCIQEYYKRVTHIMDCQQKSKSFYENQSERRRKNINQRFKKCNDNLKYLTNEREDKLQKLSIKLDSSSIGPKSWRNEKNGIYLEKFINNQKKILEEHSIKAENIINKHFNLSLKNKALREKKDRIFQTVRRDI